MIVCVRDAPREKDDFLLRLLQMRMTTQPKQISARVGLKPERVRTLCNRIVEHDLKYSGEPDDVVRSGYWRT